MIREANLISSRIKIVFGVARSVASGLDPELLQRGAHGRRRRRHPPAAGHLAAAKHLSLRHLLHLRSGERSMGSKKLALIILNIFMKKIKIRIICFNNLVNY
jgi:hypothetical protein